MPRERQHKRDRVLSGRNHVPRRRVDDDDTSLCRCIEIDVVDADARAPDHLERPRRRDDLPRDLRLAANHERIVPVHAVAQLFRRQPRPHIHIRAQALQGLDAVLRYRIADEYAERRLAVPALPFRPSLGV